MQICSIITNRNLIYREREREGGRKVERGEEERKFLIDLLEF